MAMRNEIRVICSRSDTVKYYGKGLVLGMVGGVVEMLPVELTPEELSGMLQALDEFRAELQKEQG